MENCATGSELKILTVAKVASRLELNSNSENLRKANSIQEGKTNILQKIWFELRDGINF